MRLVLIFVGCLWSASAFAQAATVAVFAATATNPNVNAPVAPPVVYATPTCNQVRVTETPPPIVNPTDGRYPDPANAARDCAVSLVGQLATLPVGASYKGAIKLGTGGYGPFTTSFAVMRITAPTNLHIVR